jgi:hypothetical protein
VPFNYFIEKYLKVVKRLSASIARALASELDGVEGERASNKLDPRIFSALLLRGACLPASNKHKQFFCYNANGQNMSAVCGFDAIVYGNLTSPSRASKVFFSLSTSQMEFYQSSALAVSKRKTRKSSESLNIQNKADKLRSKF